MSSNVLTVADQKQSHRERGPTINAEAKAAIAEVHALLNAKAEEFNARFPKISTTEFLRQFYLGGSAKGRTVHAYNAFQNATRKARELSSSASNIQTRVGDLSCFHP